MKAYYSGQFGMSLPPGHRFPMGKYELLRDRIAVELPLVSVREAAAATDGQLALVHDPDYIDAVSGGLLSESAMREIGFPWSGAMVQRSRRSVGATIAAIRSALNEGVAANMAGGTHHAFADRGSGYCVFNDVAVAARQAQGLWAGPGRLAVAVIDLDVHQGNGTARIFSNDATVFTLSLHGAKNFPFRKDASDLDVALADGCGDDEYLNALDRALTEMESRFTPDLVIYLAGADPFKGDRLGRLKLTFEGLQMRDSRVFDWCWRRRKPLALTMAGGYGIDVGDTVQVQINTFALALAHWKRWQGLPR